VAADLWRDAALAAAFLSALATPAVADTLTRTAPAEERRYGVGVAFEGRAGVSLYGDVDPTHFLQAAFALGEENAFLATADFAFGYPHTAVSGLMPYWGVGLIGVHDPSHNWTHGAHSANTSTNGGLRIPLGLNFLIPRTPVQLSGEIVPTAVVAPARYTYIQGGLNARVLF